MGQYLKATEVVADPRYVALEKSLVGDTSDEYPGVSKFGDAKYQGIINEFGADSQDELLQAVQNDDPSAIQEALTYAQDPQARKGLELILADWDSWKLCYDLACLHPELCEGVLDHKFVKLKWTKFMANAQFVYAVLSDMNCKEHFPALQDELPTQTLVTADNWDDFADDFNDQFQITPFFAFDYESYDVLQHKLFNEAKKSAGDYVDVLSQSITGMSITYGANLQHTVYISTDHVNTNNVEDTQLLEVLKMVQEGGKPLVAHNAPFEVALTDTNFLHHLDPVVCTRIMATCVDENDSHGLKDLTVRYLQYKQETYKGTLEKAGVNWMNELSGKQVLAYGCDDSACTAALADLFHIIICCEGTGEFLEKEYDTNSLLYQGLESGLRIDWDRLNELRDEDARDYTTNMEGLRSCLATYCKEEVPERSHELYNELSEFESAKMKHDDKPIEDVLSKLKALETTLIKATKYDPLVEVSNDVNFIATPLQITKVARSLGIDQDLTGVTASKITEFLAEIDTGLGGQPAVRGPDPRKDVFLELLAEASKELKKREGQHYEAFYDLCTSIVNDGAPTFTQGDELNLDSPKQMQQLFYCKLGLPIRMHSKMQHGSTREKLGYRQGGPSTDDKAIDTALADDCPVDDWRRTALIHLKTAKAAHTRKKNYWTPYPLWKHPRDEAVHGWISNCGTVTRRFTGNNPNELQMSSKDGGRVRSMVIPRQEGHVILSPDLNGEELRITGSLSLDPVIIDAYNGEVKKDLHSITAAAIAGAVLHREAPHLIQLISFNEVNGLDTMLYEDFLAWHGHDDKEIANLFKNIRKLAKGVNFLLLYVGGAGTLARNLGVPTETAELFLKAAMLAYPRLGPWQQESIEFARTHGYVLTSYGNRRHLGSGLFSADKGISSRLERQAVNSQVQGTGSDIMKVIMSEMLRTDLLGKVNGSLMVAPYDEVAISVPRAAAWDAWCMMKEVMTVTPPGHVVSQLPELKASALNWGTCIELGADPTEQEVNDMFDKQLEERAAA